MPYDLALYDLVSPYFLRGDTFGQWHAALSALVVTEHVVTTDDAGIVIRGVAHFSGEVHPYIDPSTMSFGVNAENTEGHPANDPGRRDPWIDVRDSHINFQLSAPRTVSQKISTAVAAIGGSSAFATAAAVITAYDNNVANPPPSDYPSTEFVLDMLLTTVVLRPPFLRGAKLDPSGILLTDPEHTTVRISLPKIKVRLSQGSAVNDPLNATLLSAGASSLDDTADLGVAELISMDPPYAFIGASSCVGFGFRSATLDLSNNSTPPDILSQFGYDESWTGLYLPEVRIYIAPNGAENLAFDGGARNLLIGIGASAGITGDFDIELVDQGSGSQVKVSARFYDDAGFCYAITRIDDATANVALPDHTRMVVDIDGGLTPYIASAKYDSDPDAPGRLFDLDLSSHPTRTIVITANGSQPGATPVHLTITANRKPASATLPPGSAAPAGSPGVVVLTTSVTRGADTVFSPQFRLVSETPTTAVITLDTDITTAAQTTWTINGVVQPGTSPIATLNVVQGALAVQVKADLPGTPAVSGFTAFFRFDQPPDTTVTQIAAFGLTPDNTHTSTAVDVGIASPWTTSLNGVQSTDAGSAITPLLKSLDPLTAITVKGYASLELGGQGKFDYNDALASRRASSFSALIESIAPGKFTVTHASDMTNWLNQGDPNRNLFWKIEASWPPKNAPGTSTVGNVSRPSAKPATPVPVPDNPTSANPPAPPSWFKKVGAKLRIVKNHFVACELSGKFDIQTAAESQLASGGVAHQDIPQFQGLGSQNPADGIIDFRLVIQIDDAKDIVDVTMYFGADPADRDGLMKTGWLPPNAKEDRNFGRNYLGMAIVFTPLFSAIADAIAGDGGWAELGNSLLAGGVPAAIAAIPWITVEHVIWYGGQVEVQHRPEGSQLIILLDLETAISLDVSLGGTPIITISRDAPLIVRYKAVGLLIGNPPGQPKFQFRPMFDSSKGFTIDVSKPGAIKVGKGLDNILKILGARIARNNPLLFEVDLGFAIDLGVVSIERARVRMRLDPPGDPELTAFAASVDIPGALKGRGYMQIDANKFTGQLDLTLVPVQIRIAAGLGVASIPADQGGPGTGVIVTLEVDFPVAIPLANSGIGIYGFIGLFAMNYARDESSVASANMAPALAWLKATGGDPTNIQFWKPKINTWAFGVGAILGTMGSSVIFNLKGVLLLELPGPRLLLMMKAKLLAVIPELKDANAEGTFLAVIDLDFGRGTLTIGLAIDFDIDPLLVIKIPVEAFFNFNDLSDWHLNLGSYANQIQATVLIIFDASGYLMLSGNGIPAHNNLPAVFGFSIATGLHVSFQWGGGPLYARLSAGFDAVLGFSPFRVAGILTVRGTLHLFIIDISAYADLSVDLGSDPQGNSYHRIHGDICGEVDFFFFSVSGCVSFTLGDSTIPVPDPPPLVTNLKLISRSPALVTGTGVDKPIDSGLADGVAGGNSNPGGLKVVPIDAIPALLMTMPPNQSPTLTFLGQVLQGTPGVPNADGFVQRGDVWFKYTITNVELLGPLSAGATPATWWASKSGAKALEAQLALLSWVPDPTPKAVGSSTYLDETIKQVWGTVCEPAAPAALVLYSFLLQVLGPSDTGWQLYGLPWPDPPNTVRSNPPDVSLKVTERWRCGKPFIDKLRGIIPAEVDGAFVPCPNQNANRVAGTLDASNPAARLAPINRSLLRAVLPNVSSASSSDAFNIVSSSTAVLSSSMAIDISEPQRSTNPILAIRGGGVETVVPNESLTLTDVVQRFSMGQAVSSSTLNNLASSNTPAAAVAWNCFSRVLAAPMFDHGELIAFGNQNRAGLIKQAFSQLKYRPGPLLDAVVLHTGAFEYTRVFLIVPRRLLEMKQLIVAASDSVDNLANQHTVSFTDVVPPAAFPSAWTDPTGPWSFFVKILEEQAALGGRDYVPIIVEVKGSAAADRVQIGYLPAARQILGEDTYRPYFVAAIELLRLSEVTRHDFDTTEQTKKQGVLNAALGLDSADNALLQPDHDYQVRITWDGSRERRQDGKPPADQKTVTNQQQSFWFHTDSKPPARLDPWVMVALPGEGEQHYFASEPVKVVFATNDVGTLYDTYGKKLQARLRPSNFRPVPSTATTPHPYPLNPATLKPVKGTILSPWEGAVRDLAASSLPCIDTSGSTIRHSMITMPIPLDLDTDYVLDIEMLDKAAADGTPGILVWRGSFTTGDFPTLDEFAKSFRISRISQRGVHTADIGKLQAIGTQFAAKNPEGAEFDTALVAAGLDAQPLPKSPRMVIFWDATLPDPQPAAILIDSSEPMWRNRPIPTKMTDPGPATAQRYDLDPQPWLSLDQAGGDPIVDHIVAAPGGQRALVTLKPNSRGKRIKLGLRRIAHLEPYLDGPGAIDQFSNILDLTLAAAPWEEVD